MDTLHQDILTKEEEAKQRNRRLMSFIIFLLMFLAFLGLLFNVIFDNGTTGITNGTPSDNHPPLVAKAAPTPTLPPLSSGIHRRSGANGSGVTSSSKSSIDIFNDYNYYSYNSPSSPGPTPNPNNPSVLGDFASSPNYNIFQSMVGGSGNIPGYDKSLSYLDGGSTEGDLAVGRSSSAHYRTQSGYNTDAEPRLAFWVDNNAGTFAAKKDSTTGTLPYSVTTGDFNGDGKIDLAVANFGSTSVSIYLNTGSGLPVTATSTLTTGANPTSVTTGDFNGDGKTDLAVANYNSNTVSVFINNGSPTVPFGAALSPALTAGTNPIAVTAGDFNGDGKTDLAVANAGTSGANGLSVYLNTGSALPTTANSTLTTGNNPLGITTGDFNSDGKTDLAVANNGTSGANGVFIFINNGTASPFSAALSPALTTGSSPESVSSGDFNGDGKTDLAVANNGVTGANGVSVYINTGSALPTTASYTLTAGANPRSIVTGDFNGDGEPDLAVSQEGSSGANGVFVYLNTGTAIPTTASSILTSGSLPISITAGDFNGDGEPDLVVANRTSNTASVFLNNNGVYLGQLDIAATRFGSAGFNVLAYNASGYAVQVVGTSLYNGSHYLTNLATDTASSAGTEQFGINVVANTSPLVGANPLQIPSSNFSFGVAGDGITSAYATPNLFRYNSGEVIASSPRDSGYTDYTMSIIANISGSTPVLFKYSTELVLICTATF